MKLKFLAETKYFTFARLDQCFHPVCFISITFNFAGVIPDYIVEVCLVDLDNYSLKTGVIKGARDILFIQFIQLLSVFLILLTSGELNKSNL